MRLVSDGGGLVLGTISTIVTARVLGPAGKGTLAALTFITVIAAQCATLGLGDAAVVRVGQARASIQQALSSSLGVVSAASLAGAVLVLAYSVAQLPVQDDWVWPAIGIACLTVVVSTAAQLLIFIVYARERIVAVSVVTIAMATTTAVGVMIFCLVLDLDVLGGALASLLAATVGLVAAAVMLMRAGIGFRPRWDPSYVRPALHFGLRTQLANVLAYSSARVDLLLVFALAGQSEAGIYSIALTMGTITGFVAIALSFGTFPRMARMSDPDALDLAVKMARATVLLGLAVAMMLSLVLPPLISILLGHEYDGSLTPAIVLLFANVLWGTQWLLSRAVAAHGNPRLLVTSFGVNLATMAVVDIALIPHFGALGAATGSVVAAAAGTAVCLHAYRARGIQIRSLLPQRDDLRALRKLVERLRSA